MRRYLTVPVLVAILVSGAMACSDDGDGGDDAASTTTAGDTSAGSGGGDTTTTAGGEVAVVIGTAQSDYGEVLTDTDGLTLYIFTDDGTGDPTCLDACTDIWPAVIAENIETRGELDIEVNLVDGDAAERQVTVNGRPVYTYSGDSEPGMATGQGLGGKWWVLDVDGNPIESTETSATTTTLAE
jgi:predicted lipoprotein with Yx(FWY)xxD motif